MNLAAMEIDWGSVGLRLIAVVGALVIWFWTQALIGRRGDADGTLLGDRLHDWTAGWHRWLKTHPRATNRGLIVSSGLIDIFGLLLVASALFGPSFAPFLALIIVFSMRQVCQSMCMLPPPPGKIWRHPGFPSLLVTYHVSNDLFFSGHTALAVLGAIEAVQIAPPVAGCSGGRHRTRPDAFHHRPARPLHPRCGRGHLRRVRRQRPRPPTRPMGRRMVEGLSGRPPDRGRLHTTHHL